MSGIDQSHVRAFSQSLYYFQAYKASGIICKKIADKDEKGLVTVDEQTETLISEHEARPCLDPLTIISLFGDILSNIV